MDYDSASALFTIVPVHAGFQKTYHMYAGKDLIDEVIWSASGGLKGLGRGQAPPQLKDGFSWSSKEREFKPTKHRVRGMHAGTLFHAGMEHPDNCYPRELEDTFHYNQNVRQEVDYVKQHVFRDSAIVKREVDVSSAPYCFAGRLDAIVQDEHGLEYILDYKRSRATFELVKNLRVMKKPPAGIFLPEFMNVGEYVGQDVKSEVLNYIAQLAFYHVLYRMKENTTSVSKYGIILVVDPHDSDYRADEFPQVWAIFIDLTRPITVKKNTQPALTWVHETLVENMLTKSLKRKCLSVPSVEEGMKRMQALYLELACVVHRIVQDQVDPREDVHKAKRVKRVLIQTIDDDDS
jgi:hypothetical protein